MTVTLGSPTEKQKEALRARAKHIGYGGARGGGKSWFVRFKAKGMCFRYSGIRCLIVRRTYPELVENHIRILRSELFGIARYNDKDKAFVFPNGSVIKFTYCANDRDLDNLQGQEYDVIFIDEATQFSEFQLKVITACLRGTGSFPRRIYYTCNPGGQGHGYIKRIFIDRRYNDDERAEDYEFIQALVTDNAPLMESQPDYVSQLDSLPEKVRKAWRYGDWNVFSGQFFEEFTDDPAHYSDRRYTHVIEPFAVPSDWNIYRSYDFGYAKPFSVGWWAVDREGRAYRILELYGCTKEPNEGVKWSPDRQFEESLRIEREHPLLAGKRISGVADPSIWDSSRGESINDTAVRHGIIFGKGDNRRLPGWMQMHYRFQFDENGFPMLYVFKNCKAFIRTIPLLVYSEIHPEDLDTGMEDHVADETRYFCMSRPIKPTAKERPREIRDDPLDLEGDGFDRGLLPATPRMIIEEEKE